MAKSMTVGKRENEKKRIAKREEKLKKKENKKLSGSSNSFEDMIAYVDENRENNLNSSDRECQKRRDQPG